MNIFSSNHTKSKSFSVTEIFLVEGFSECWVKNTKNNNQERNE